MEKEMLLEKFIQNRLTEAEQKQFDKLYAADDNFKAEVDFHTNISRVTEAEDDDSFREILSSFESERLLETARDGNISETPSVLEMEVKSEKTAVKRFPTKWLVAASIALIAGLTYFFIPDSSTSPQELFAQNFEPYPNIVNPIVRGEESVDQKTKAYVAYQQKDYTTAEALFTELLTVQDQPHYLFYKANALLQLNKGREAIPLLQKRLKINDKLTEKTGWYLAMAYLQVGDSENAEKILQTVVSDGKFKVEEAKELLTSLKKLTPK